jgi:hypothetical protein
VEPDQLAETITQLKQENRRLRNTALGLSLLLLRQAAVHTLMGHSASSTDVHELMRLAQECFDCARLPDLKVPIAEGLQAAGHELMARAVEIETKLQRAQAKNTAPPPV